MKCVSWLTTVLAIAAVLTVSAISAEPPTMQVRVSSADQAILSKLHAMGFEVVYLGEGRADVFTAAEGLKSLRSLGCTIEIIHEDVVAFYASRLAAAPEPFGGYKTLSQIYTYLDAMIAAHPDIMTDKISVGQSIEGRDIWAVKISDNPDLDEDEPELLFSSLIHAREVITGEVLLYFMDHLTDNYGTDPEATEIVDNREIWFVLVVNPDGYYFNEVIAPDGGGMWRKNRRDNLDGTFGVDPNRNFGYMWGYDDYGSSPLTSDPDYRGMAAFSEPEAQAIQDFCMAHNFVIAADYHSYGDYYLWPWRYSGYHTPDEGLFAVLADSMAAYNGYISANEVLYPSNGVVTDWQYGEQSLKPKSLTFGIEVGDSHDGFWPKLDRIDDLVTENLGANLFLCRVADQVYSLASPERPLIHVPEGIQDSDYTVSWSSDDTLNPAVAFELLELQSPMTAVDYCDDLDNWEGGTLKAIEYYSDPYAILMGYSTEVGLYLNWVSLTTKEAVYIVEGDSLQFWTYYSLAEGYSYVYVQASTDGETFETVAGSLTTNDNPFGYNEGDGITGESDGWLRGLFDLSAYADGNLWVRFILNHVDPDPEVPSTSRFYIDDVELFKEFNIQTVTASDIVDTLWNFTGKAEGDYYYRVRAKDAQDQWGKFSHGYGLVKVGEGSTYVCGDANGDEEVTQLDVMYLIEYLHKDGPAPDPIEAGDANGDGTVDKYDASYLIEYLHKDGPEPICP
jgi:hypothetical protein